MPGSCAVAGCSNWRNKPGLEKTISFHRFPKDESLCKAWIVRCARKDKINLSNATVCSEHFDESCFVRDLRNELLSLPTRRILHEHALPTRRLPCKKSPVKSPGRERRAMKRQSKTLIEDLLTDDGAAAEEVIVAVQETEPNSCSQCRQLLIDNEELKTECNSLRQKIKQLQDKHARDTKMFNNRIAYWRKISKSGESKCTNSKQQLARNIAGIFSSGQIRCLQRGKKYVQWTKEDILHALELRTVSRKAYTFLRNTRRVPLPSLSTLKRWVSGYKCSPGISDFALDIMTAKKSRFTEWDRACVLSFDEMSVSSQLCYDMKDDKVYGPHTKVLVFMIRGLLTNWKQPIYFDFDVTMTKQLILDVILRVEKTGYNVKACVCDMAGGNRGLLTSLGVSEVKPYFPNPADESMRVWCLADVPHALKLLRNHLLDSGFRLSTGTEITKEPIKQLMEKDASELKIAHKLTPLHLNVVGMERQKVRLAAQLLSRTTASAIRYAIPEKSELADFIQLVNDSFDVLNSRTKQGKFPWMSAYGLSLESQDKLLDEMYNTMSSMRVIGKTTLLPFHEGFMMSIAATKGLLKDINTAYGADYILTARLNQDCLENFYSQLRGLGHHYDHPSPIEVRNRFRLLLLTRNSVDLNSSNVQRDATADALTDDDDITSSSVYLSVEVFYLFCILNVDF